MHKILSVCQTCLPSPHSSLHTVFFWADRHCATFAFAVGKGAEGIPLTGTNIVESLRYSVWTLKSIKWQIEFRQKMAIGGSGGHKNYMSFCRELQSTRHQRECQFNNCSNNNTSNNSKRKRKTTKITKRRRSRSRQCRRLFATGQPTVPSVPGLAN